MFCTHTHTHTQNKNIWFYLIPVMDTFILIFLWTHLSKGQIKNITYICFDHNHRFISALTMKTDNYICINQKHVSCYLLAMINIFVWLFFKECDMKMAKFKDVTNVTKNHLKFTQKMYDLIPMIKIDSPPVMFGKTLMFILDYDSLFSLRVVR